MATQWISPTWRMPEESNQSKFENYSLDFDGTQYITLGSTISGTGAATISMWLNTDSISDNIRILSNTDNYFFSVKFDGTGNIQVYGPTEGWMTVVSGLSVDNQWFHLCLVFDGAGNVTGYKNGSIGSTQTTTANRSNLGLAAKINLAYGTNYNGGMTEVSLFDYALTDGTGGTENQIGNLYNSGTPINPMALTPAPVAYYPLGSGSTGDAGTSPSTLTVPNESVPDATVFDFTSIHQYIRASNFGSIFSGKTTFSFSGWFKLSTLLSFQQIFNIYDGSDTWFAINTYSNQLRFNINYAGSSTYAYVNQAHLLTGTGTWFHFAGSFDGSEAANANRVKVYINGTPATLTFVGTPATSMGTIPATANTQIGGHVGSFNGFQPTGSASNIQLWDTNLSPSEITTLYNNGTPLLTGTQPEAANIKAWWKMNVDTSFWNPVLNQWIITDYAN